MGDIGAVPNAQQEWSVSGIVRHEYRDGVLLFLVCWAATFLPVGHPTEPWGVTQVERVSDTQVLVHWANTWEPSTSLQDADGVRTQAYADYLQLHPELH